MVPRSSVLRMVMNILQTFVQLLFTITIAETKKSHFSQAFRARDATAFSLSLSLSLSLSPGSLSLSPN